ncbi:uncharacterized protein EV422DRAFT_95979 [Fimicolochytrium jonesii]|uniref:uncharacterized protein n=1 Tax=Fimicolochytrium jonesii TaxID=1396493 RepID=UPI0022FDC858|nr:uncharacterized protein EV422DRAFT_95979 [Fimicolochytrium jonesii]KAI8820034.1 hypothetical protein EV422DRAFT_95979 [Fimicolochytrium jonesii]
MDSLVLNISCTSISSNSAIIALLANLSNQRPTVHSDPHTLKMRATLAFLAPLLAASALGAPAAPAAPAPDAAAAACSASDWNILENRDLKDIGDLTAHPVFKKKFNSACECANAVSAVPSPKAAFFVWNSSTKECFPKGVTPFTQENSQRLTIADQISDKIDDAEKGLFATNAQLKKVCGASFRIPTQWANVETGCSEICAANTFVDGCDFAITIAAHAGKP